MPDIREVLRGAAPEVGNPDVDRVTRRARTRRAIPRALAASAVVVAAVVGMIVVTTRDGSNPGRIDTGRPSVPTTVPAPREPPTTTATTPPPTALAPGEDRLSTDSRLGYEGLGPIKLGMSLDDAVAAAHVKVQSQPIICETALYGESGSGVDSIVVWYNTDHVTIDTIVVYHPGLRTISGIQVGDSRADVQTTYPGAVARKSARSDPASPTTLVIRGDDGHVIEFTFGAEDAVTSMTLSKSLDQIDGNSLC